MSYNLSDNVNEDFEFTVSGVAYKMRYPLVSEIETMKELADAAERDRKAGKKDTNEKEMQEWMYQFITPVNPDSPPISEILKKQNVKVLQNFNSMFRTEFGIE